MPTRRYVVEPIQGFSPQVGQLVSMLDYTRATTLADIDGLTQEELDHRLDEGANSIGMILEHIAAVEEHYQLRTFGWTLDGDVEERYRMALRIDEASHERFRGRPLGAYLQRLSEVRERSLAELAKRDDEWLYGRDDASDRPANRYFWWFHVVEEETSHRGQIRMLRKRLPGA